MDTRGRLVDVLELPGFVAENDGIWIGYLSFENRVGNIEVIALVALVINQDRWKIKSAQVGEQALEEFFRR